MIKSVKELHPPIKGILLSTDYDRLYKLAKSGHRVPGWIWNDRQNFWDIVEVRKAYNYIFIGVRGISYNTFSMKKDQFIQCCQVWELHFIDIKKEAKNEY